MGLKLLTLLSVGLDRWIGSLAESMLTAAVERERRRRNYRPTRLPHQALLAMVHDDPKAELDAQELKRATEAGLVTRVDGETRMTPIGRYVLGVGPVEQL